jgi:DNA (cytosine-5)-methyltransferase 1
MNVVDLFCGCGGLSLGFETAGFNVVAAYDNWDAAVAVYKENFKHPVHQVNLSNVEEVCAHISKYKPDMIIGGPPCQDFSSAGLRNEDNGRGDLTLSYAQIISALRPKWFVMENVSTITKTRKLAAAQQIFKAAGYGLSQVILDASLCGVPQKRKRFFLIGNLGADDGFIESHIKSRIATKPMTVKDYLGDKIDVEFYYRHPRSYARRGIFSVHEPSPTIRGVNRPIPAGYPIHPNDPIKDLSAVRPLTTKERSMIQTFPESFVFSGTKSEIEQMIGNAVPVNLGCFVGKAILDYMNQSALVPHELLLNFDDASWSATEPRIASSI